MHPRLIFWLTVVGLGLMLTPMPVDWAPAWENLARGAGIALIATVVEQIYRTIREKRD